MQIFCAFPKPPRFKDGFTSSPRTVQRASSTTGLRCYPKSLSAASWLPRLPHSHGKDRVSFEIGPTAQSRCPQKRHFIPLDAYLIFLAFIIRSVFPRSSESNRSSSHLIRAVTVSCRVFIDGCRVARHLTELSALQARGGLPLWKLVDSTRVLALVPTATCNRVSISRFTLRSR